MILVETALFLVFEIIQLILKVYISYQEKYFVN